MGNKELAEFLLSPRGPFWNLRSCWDLSHILIQRTFSNHLGLILQNRPWKILLQRVEQADWVLKFHTWKTVQHLNPSQAWDFKSSVWTLYLELCVLLTCVALREVWKLLPPPTGGWAACWGRLLAMWEDVAQQPRLPGVKDGLLLLLSPLSSLLELESSVKQLPRQISQLELGQCDHFGWEVFVRENVSKRHFFETLFGFVLLIVSLQPLDCDWDQLWIALSLNPAPSSLCSILFILHRGHISIVQYFIQKLYFPEFKKLKRLLAQNKHIWFT